MRSQVTCFGNDHGAGKTQIMGSTPMAATNYLLAQSGRATYILITLVAVTPMDVVG